MDTFKLPSYFVIPDTNILFTPDVRRIACSEFEDQWKSAAQTTKLQLILPEIVAEEILFRRYWEAARANANAAKALNQIAAVTGTTAPILKTEARIKKDIRTVFRKWLSNHQGHIAKTPTSRIRWREVVDAAVWRRPPFSPFCPDKPDSEKGFRDALILESIVHILRSNPNHHISILTADDLLKTALSPRMSGFKNAALFGSIAEFTSSLRLLSERLNQSFVEAIVAIAPTIFFARDNPDCLYSKAEVYNKIRAQYGKDLDCPVEEPSSFGDVLFPALMQISHAIINKDAPKILVEADYRPVSDERILMGTTSFVVLSGGRYSWKTVVEFGRLFLDERMRQTGHSALGTKLRVAEFDVHWSCDISAEAKFSNYHLGDIKLSKQDLQINWSLNTERFGLNTETPALQLPASD